jgi:hypothetical protein
MLGRSIIAWINATNNPLLNMAPFGVGEWQGHTHNRNVKFQVNIFLKRYNV